MVDKITNPPSQKDLIDKVNELVDDKQDTLVSGTNIKTVGGTSLLGSGNIALPTVNNATLTIQKNGTNVATFTANASSNVTANISVPTNTNELTNGAGYITSADLPTNHVTTDTAQTISANKTFTGVTRFQNGSGNGCVILGADVAQTTVSTNTRKLGRMSFHTYTNTLDCAFVSTDSDNIYNYVEFGGRSGDTANTSPDILRFTVANSHNSKNNKTHALEISYSGGANFTVLPKYNTKNLATEAWVSNQKYVNSTTLTTTLNNYVLSADLADVATTGDYDDLINKPTEVTELTVSGWGFTKNTGTVTSVNNVSPVNGNVTLSIPTVNNPTITFTQGGTTKGTITLNQSSNQTIALDAGGGSPTWSYDSTTRTLTIN